MAYTELAGRQHSKEPTRILYLVRLISATLTDCPKVGTDLASPAATKEFSETETPTCARSQTDEVRYPGRYLFLCVFEVPLLRTEMGSV